MYWFWVKHPCILYLYMLPLSSSSHCRFAHGEGARGVYEFLLGIPCRECLNVVSSLGYLFYLCNVWGCMYTTIPFKFRGSRRYICNPSYCHKQIGSIKLSHYFHFFFRGCMSEVVAASYSISYYIYIYIYWEILVLFPLLLYSSMMRANTRIHRSLKVVFVCLLIIHRRLYICIII